MRMLLGRSGIGTKTGVAKTFMRIQETAWNGTRNRTIVIWQNERIGSNKMLLNHLFAGESVFMVGFWPDSSFESVSSNSAGLS